MSFFSVFSLRTHTPIYPFFTPSPRALPTSYFYPAARTRASSNTITCNVMTSLLRPCVCVCVFVYVWCVYVCACVDKACPVIKADQNRIRIVRSGSCCSISLSLFFYNIHLLVSFPESVSAPRIGNTLPKQSIGVHTMEADAAAPETFFHLFFKLYAIMGCVRWQTI